MEITLSKITGFKCSEPVIVIQDAKGIFYHMENPTEKEILFNLPSGIFSTENKVEKLPRPLTYICAPLPKPDKNHIPVEMEFIICDNPNKCSIDIKTGKVFIDYSLAERETPFLNFVLFHEVGHNYYKGGIHEHYCDFFAAKMMLEKYGFNPSQVYFAQEFCLSERSIDRKDLLFNYLQKTVIR